MPKHEKSENQRVMVQKLYVLIITAPPSLEGLRVTCDHKKEGREVESGNDVESFSFSHFSYILLFFPCPFIGHVHLTLEI